ncbi:MAG: 7-cyano-7-deazaguanine synthase [Chloroflexota bacterium]
MTTVQLVRNPADTRHGATDLVICPDVNFQIGRQQFTVSFGEPTSLELDLLALASAVYGSDIAIKRGEREAFARTIEVFVPVVNYAVLEMVRPKIEVALYRLTGDNWTVRLLQVPGEVEVAEWYADGQDEVLLFSGGLDSLAGAYKRLTEGVSHLTLVSHVTHNPAVLASQEALFQQLQLTFGDRVSRKHFHVSGRDHPGFPFPADDEREETQRSRSFLFLILGALVARRLRAGKLLMMAENGQMAIHLPLNQARTGGFSTRTAHPDFLARMQDILRSALRYEVTIVNPFLYMTKAEVISQLVAERPDLIGLSGSCWRAARVGSKHCGECVPCLIRRIALERHGIVPSDYARDLFSEQVPGLKEDDRGKRNLYDLVEFCRHFLDDALRASVVEDYPEIVSRHFDGARATDMYARFAHEAQGVLSRYAGTRDLLA